MPSKSAVFLIQANLDYLVELKATDDFLWSTRNLGNRSVNGFPWNLLNDRSCIDANSSIINNSTWMSALIKSYLDNTDFSRYNDTTLNTFKINSTALYQTMTTLSSCLLQYKQDLDSLANWVNTTIATLSVVADMSSIQPTVNLLNAFYSNGSYMVNISKDYLSGNATKMQLATSFSDSQYVGAIVHCVDSLMSDLQTSIFDQLESIISAQQSLIVTTYMTALGKFNSLQKYMSVADQSIETFLRKLIIWRHPVVSLQDKQVRCNLFIVFILFNNSSYM